MGATAIIGPTLGRRDEYGHRDRNHDGHFADDGLWTLNDDRRWLFGFGRRCRNGLERLFFRNGGRLPAAADHCDDHGLADAGVLQHLQRRRVHREHRAVDLDEREQHVVAQAGLREFHDVPDGERLRLGSRQSHDSGEDEGSGQRARSSHGASRLFNSATKVPVGPEFFCGSCASPPC